MKYENNSAIDDSLINAVIKAWGFRRVKADLEDIRGIAGDITSTGANAGYSGFIYYSDTLPFTRKNRAAIDKLLKYYAEDMGMSTVELLAGFNCFKSEDVYTLLSERDNTILLNGLAWFACEEVARAIDDNTIEF